MQKQFTVFKANIRERKWCCDENSPSNSSFILVSHLSSCSIQFEWVLSHLPDSLSLSGGCYLSATFCDNFCLLRQLTFCCKCDMIHSVTWTQYMDIWMMSMNEMPSKMKLSPSNLNEGWMFEKNKIKLNICIEEKIYIPLERNHSSNIQCCGIEIITYAP